LGAKCQPKYSARKTAGTHKQKEQTLKDPVNPRWRFDTLCVHAGEGIDPDTKALRRPIHMANSYEYPADIEKLLETISWEHLDKFQYTREHSPTPRHLEERLARLEGGQDCIVSASGIFSRIAPEGPFRYLPRIKNPSRL